MLCLGYILETIRFRKLILGRDISWGYMCARSWCDLDMSVDLAYLMPFDVSTRISDTIYLSYISLISVYLNLGCCTFGCLLV